jgi:hypothetical protein
MVGELESASFISFSFVSVGTAIQFDHQAVFGAEEIGNVRPKWMLPAKFQPVKPAIPECIPQNIFCGRQLMAKFLSPNPYLWMRIPFHTPCLSQQNIN